MTVAGAETLTYDPANGLLTGTTLGVVTDSLTYNGFAEVDSYTASVNASAVFSTSFVRDKLGRISQKTETTQDVTHVFDYTYDTAGRLTDVDRDSLPFASYTYDSNGNRLNNGAIYDDQDRLLSQGSATYTYTANGELLTKTDGSGTTTFNYDVLGNLISVTLPGGTLIEYIIDGRNRRVGKKVNGTLEKGWLYKDGLNPIVELDGAGNVVSRFVYSSRANVPDFILKGENTYRIISDNLGSPRLVIDTTTGTVIQTMDFDEWGNVTADTNPEFQPFGFAGGLYDTDTQLVRFGARDYDAETGRWASKDPIRFSGGDTNLFGYILNDSINFIDSSGLSPLGWIIQLTKAGIRKVSPLSSKAEAQLARKQGKNVLAKTKQQAKEIEKGVVGKQDLIKHKGHNLSGGKRGNPHFQTKGKYGHTFWGGTIGLIGSLLDPFDAISGELSNIEDQDLDGNGIPDWQEEFAQNLICPQ